jgi:hypothetical protein
MFAAVSIISLFILKNKQNGNCIKWPLLNIPAGNPASIYTILVNLANNGIGRKGIK